MNGGYDEGYEAVACFWGTGPGSLVAEFIQNHDCRNLRVLDVGGGEGKNANALALAGANVTVIDSSTRAIENGKRAFPGVQIEWVCGSATRLNHLGVYDLVVSYGFLHCLASLADVTGLTEELKNATSPGGFHIICAFNDRSQDLSRAHPGFHPLLLDHSDYLHLYSDWEIVSASDRDLHEAHPHNRIPHHHSMTRMIARKPQ